MLPRGQRVDDQSETKSFRFRLALAATKYPVQIALIIALVVLVYPVALLVESNADQKASNKRLRAASADLREALATIAGNRKVLFARQCSQSNRNAKANNRQTTYFQALIVKSARDSKRLESVLAPPPYAERVRRARRQAARLDKFKVPLRDCAAEARQVETEFEKLSGG